MNPVHPGELLREELDQRGLSANALAKELMLPANRITAILKGQRRVTADTALRLSKFLGTKPLFWLSIQNTYDLALAEQKHGETIGKIKSAA